MPVSLCVSLFESACASVSMFVCVRRHRALDPRFGLVCAEVSGVSLRLLRDNRYGSDQNHEDEKQLGGGAGVTVVVMFGIIRVRHVKHSYFTNSGVTNRSSSAHHDY